MKAFFTTVMVALSFENNLTYAPLEPSDSLRWPVYQVGSSHCAGLE